MLKRLESIVFLFILVLFTLLGCSGSEEADVSPQVRTPKLIGLTEPLAYSKGQKISPLVINNTGDPVISCTITPDLPVGLGIATDSGNCQITGTPTVTLVETEFTITGTDAEGETDTATVSIVVNEVNNGIPSENKPPSLVSLTELLAYFKDQAIIPLVINNTGDPVVECTVDSNLPNGLEIVTDSGNCRIAGTPTVTLVETEFTITGTDAEGETDTATVSIVVHEERPPLLANVATVQAYFKDHAIIPLVIANTGDPVVDCTINPNLPDDLAIAVDSGNCRIAGTPTVTLVETEFTITGTDAEGETDTATVSIVVHEERPPLLANVATTQAYFKDYAITPLVIANTGDPVVECAVDSNLPIGLAIAVDSGNCRITGTPTVTLVETEFTITGTDAEGETDTATVSIVVHEERPPLLANVVTVQAYFKDHAITPLVIANTGDPVVECAVDSNLPIGLAIAVDSGNCRIAGTPTVTLVETEFTITGTDAEGETDTATVSIVIHEERPPLLANVATTQAYFKDYAITPLVIANTGDPVVECAVDSNLPIGLAIAVDSNTCRITGTPTVTLVETEFTITGTDAEGETDTATVSIVVHEERAPSLANVATVQAYFKDHAITPLVIANTGDPVVECAVDSNLPIGLAIAVDSNTCRITGTPTVTLVETEFTITGTDAEGETDTATVSIVISAPALSNLSASILSPTFPLATASDTTITIQTNQDSRISIHKGLDCSGGQVVSKNVVNSASSVKIVLLANSLKKDNTDTDFSNFFTLCQEDKELSNAMAKITSFMAHDLGVHKGLDADVYQIGDIWSKVFVRERSEVNSSRFVSSYSHLVQRLFGRYTAGIGDSFTMPEIDSAPFPEHFKRLGRATAFFSIDFVFEDPIYKFKSSGTAFYIGKNTYKDKTYYIMATNHHVACGYLPICKRDLIDTDNLHESVVSFPLYEYDFDHVSLIGTWADIDLGLFAFEIPDSKITEDARKSMDANLSSSRLEFDFTSDIYPGQELVTAGYGSNLNPKNATYPGNTGSPSLMFSFDNDCKVFSRRNEFPLRPLGFGSALSGRYDGAFSFAHGCDVSHGDSGSATMDRKTGKIVGIMWRAAIVKSSNTQNSEYINTYFMDQKVGVEAFTDLALAVPAPKIKTYLDDWVIKNNATLGRIQKRLIKKFLNKELE